MSSSLGVLGCPSNQFSLGISIIHWLFLNPLASMVSSYCTMCVVQLIQFFERAAHGCHFGVMIGLAVTGPKFSTPSPSMYPAMQTISLILMVSQFVLFCQYGSTLMFTWRYKAIRLPLIDVMASLLIASIIYMSFGFAFEFKLTMCIMVGTLYLFWK